MRSKKEEVQTTQWHTHEIMGRNFLETHARYTQRKEIENFIEVGDRVENFWKVDDSPHYNYFSAKFRDLDPYLGKLTSS